MYSSAEQMENASRCIDADTGHTFRNSADIQIEINCTLVALINFISK